MSQFDYFQWRMRDQEFPCLFAKGLPHSHRTGAVLLRDIDAIAPKDIAAEIDACVQAAMKSPASVIATMVIPAWDERTMAASFVELCELSGWRINFLKPIEFANERLIPVGLHYVLREKTDQAPGVETVPMALGPFASFPPSRRCPVPVLELSVDINATGTKKQNGYLRSDFARLETPWIHADRWSEIREKVKKRRVKINGGNDPRAVASNTATFSMDCASLFHV